MELLEEEERKARTVAGVAHLEIPADLAYVLSKVEDWQGIHSERHLVNVVGNVVPKDMNFVLPKDIDSYVFTKCVNIYFKQGWWMRRNPVSKAFLAKQNESQLKDAISMFQLVLRFMNDASLTGKREKVLADYIAQQGMSREYLRDEIYCQLCNQTWGNRNDVNNERGWQLMAHCLSAFPPSQVIAKYLLKYVSDQAYNGYKVYCQHKLLQCMELLPDIHRYYPPCLLEWKANRKRAGMAVEAIFPDSESGVGHVESWTTGEEFAAHLLQCRQIYENQYGWSVSLRDDNDLYELNGADYVLDLLAEMEVPPGFPYKRAPFIVVTDRTRETSPARKDLFDDSPHNSDAPRFVNIETEELREPVPASPRPAPKPEHFFQYGDMNGAQDETMSEPEQPRISRNSILNVRYVNGQGSQIPRSPARSASPPPHTGAPPPPPPPPPPLMLASDRPMSIQPPPAQPSTSDQLSNSKLNRRYASSSDDHPQTGQRYDSYSSGSPSPDGNVPNGRMQNGNVHNGNDSLELSTSGLNRRYSKKQSPSAAGPNTHSAKEEILRRQKSSEGPRPSGRVSVTSYRSGGWSDMDRWVDNVFDPILTNDMDGLSDARTLENRLKGGGDKALPYTPVVQVPNSILAANLSSPPIINPATAAPNTFTGPASGAINLGPIQMVPDHNALLSQAAQQQALAQQLAQQHASQQMAAQQLAQQQALVQAQQSQIHQQTASLQAQLQQHALHNQILKQTVDRELLELQLKTIQQNKEPSKPPAQPSATTRAWSPPPAQPVILAGPSRNPPPAFTVELRPGSPPPRVLSPPGSPPVRPKPMKKPPPAPPSQGSREKAQGEIDKSHPGGVKTLKSRYETKVVPPASYQIFNSKTPNRFSQRARSPVQMEENEAERKESKVTFSEDITTIPKDKTSPPPSLKVSPPPSTVGASPPPPPPPPPVIQDQVLSSPPLPPPPPPQVSLPGDQQGGNKKTRVGKIQWPPPKEETGKKEELDVGRLQIDEKKGGNGSQRALHTKEDVHSRTMELIRSRSIDPLEEPEKKQIGPRPSIMPPPEEKVNIDMNNRRKILEQRLSTAGVLKEKEAKFSGAFWQAESSDDDERLAGSVNGPPSPGPNVEPEVEPNMSHDLRALEHVRTQLFQQNYSPFFTYNRVPWVLEIRKEVFTPSEKADNPVVVQLLFCQIVQDVFSNASIRISKEDRMRLRSMLESQGITPRNVLASHKAHIKKQVIDITREWPCYFSRLFPVSGGRKFGHVQVVGVSHSGVRLLSREKDLFDDTLSVQDHFRFEDIVDVSVPKASTIQFHVRDHYIILYTPKATLIKTLVESFCIESEKSSIYVRAVRNYVTRERTLLSFQEGDVIKLTDKDMPLDKGWLYGAHHGQSGMFPKEYIQPLAKHEVERIEGGTKYVVRSHARPNPIAAEGDINDNLYNTLPDEGKMSMLEFAMLHFRESPYRYEMKRTDETGSIHGTFKLISSLKAKTLQKEHNKKRGISDWTWKEQVDMVKWTKSPIQASLLKFESPQMNKMALECFFCIMRYMGDYPLARGQKTIDCVYFILKACHNHPELRDEVYSQLVKQTTNNRSTRPDSHQQGWRLVSIVTSYFDCTDILKPYLFKYLELTAYDNQQPHQTIAAQCLQNIRTTFRFGGRKNVPSRVEIEALTRGRNTKRQMCVLPGGMPVVLNVRSCSVVLDAIEQICSRLDIHDPLEREEFTIFYVIESENRYCPLNRDEYIFDITTELANQKKEFYLLFQRTTWVFTLRLDNNPQYTDVMYHQSIPDYLDGFLLPMPSNSLPEYIKDELSGLAALQLRAAELKAMPPMRDVLVKFPRNVQNLSDMGGQRWTNLVHQKIRDVEHLNSHQAKQTFLDILSRWPLFGSTFFSIKSVGDPRIKADCLMAINKAGVHFLHSKTHETLISYPFSEVISTRRYKSETNVNYLDMKCGDLMVQKITRIETDQGTDISSLIGQYIKIFGHMKQRGK